MSSELHPCAPMGCRLYKGRLFGIELLSLIFPSSMPKWRNVQFSNSSPRLSLPRLSAWTNQAFVCHINVPPLAMWLPSGGDHLRMRSSVHMQLPDILMTDQNYLVWPCGNTNQSARQLLLIVPTSMVGITNPSNGLAAVSRLMLLLVLISIRLMLLGTDVWWIAVNQVLAERLTGSMHSFFIANQYALPLLTSKR